MRSWRLEFLTHGNSVPTLVLALALTALLRHAKSTQAILASALSHWPLTLITNTSPAFFVLSQCTADAQAINFLSRTHTHLGHNITPSSQWTPKHPPMNNPHPKDRYPWACRILHKYYIRCAPHNYCKGIFVLNTYHPHR